MYSTLLLVPLHLFLTGAYARSIVLRARSGWPRVAACLPHLLATLLITAPLKRSCGLLPYLYAYFFLGLAGCKVCRAVVADAAPTSGVWQRACRPLQLQPHQHTHAPRPGSSPPT